MKPIIMRLFRKEYIISYTHSKGNGRILMGWQSLLGIRRKEIEYIEKYIGATCEFENVIINNIQRIKWYGI